MTVDVRKVKEIQASTGCSLSEANHIALRLDLIERAEKAVCIDQLKQVVKELIIEVIKP